MKPTSTVITVNGKLIIVNESYDSVDDKLVAARAGDALVKLTLEGSSREISIRARAVDFFHSVAQRAPLSQVNG